MAGSNLFSPSMESLPSSEGLGGEISSRDMETGSQETRGESEYNLSSRVIDSHGATSNASSHLAHGEHTSYGVGGNRKGKRLAANTGGKGRGHAAKRTRKQKWNGSEKRRVLECKRNELIVQLIGHAVNVVDLEKLSKTIQWFHRASELLPSRDSVSCQRQWDTIKKDRNAVFDYELKRRSSASKYHDRSYWDLTTDQRNDVNRERRSTKLHELPPMFPREMYELFGLITILIISKKNQDRQKKLAGKNKIGKKNQDSSKEIESIQGGVNYLRSSSIPSTSTLVTDTAILPQVPSEGPSHEPSDDNTLPRDMRGFIDHLMSSIQPLLKIEIEAQIKPLISALQGAREDKQKHRDKILAIEEKKVALQREDVNILKTLLANSVGDAGSRNSQAPEVVYNAGPSAASAQAQYFHAGSPSQAILATVNRAGQLCSNFNHTGAQAEVVAYSNVQTSASNLGQECDPFIGATHQPNIARPDLYASGDAQACQVAERSLVNAEQFPMYHQIMGPPNQVQNSSTFSGYHSQTQPEN